MWPFWLMFLVPAWAVLTNARLPARQATVVWIVVGATFALMMGLRHEVGGDWGSYLPLFLDTARGTFVESVTGGDPGYYGFNWIIAKLGGGIYAVNLLCSIILMSGTVVFCRQQPWPWLALLAAVPYMLIVVGMGYTRQAVALGFALMALAALGRGGVRGFVVLVFVGALFHKSAVLLLPIAALAASRNRFFTWAMVGATTLLTYYLLLSAATDQLWQNYVESGYQSSGAKIRVIMNAIPALLIFLFGKRLVPDPHERKLWLWMAGFALLCLPLVGLASTAVDRVALYMIPIQLFVSARLPLLARTVFVRTSLVLGIVGFYTAVLFVWLNFATHSQYWLPYQFMPL